ncbi:MAG: cytochrome c [Sedimenticola sp.]
MKSISTTLFFLITLITTLPAVAFDTAAGKELLEEHCTECHQDDLYTSADRKVNSRSRLTTQVHHCQVMQGLGWFDDEVGDTAEYLNQQFYKFK